MRRRMRRPTVRATRSSVGRLRALRGSTYGLPRRAPWRRGCQSVSTINDRVESMYYGTMPRTRSSQSTPMLPSVPRTPYYIYDTGKVRRQSSLLRTSGGGLFKILYSVKACAIVPLLEIVERECDGLSVSSCFELELGRDVLKAGHQLHFIATHVLKESHELLCRKADRLTLNSLAQWKSASALLQWLDLGLRVNPGLSIVDDRRYDPCHAHSRLGVPLGEVTAHWRDGALDGLSGIHFHTACCATSWEPMLRTVRVLVRELGPMLRELVWINLGGGYQWDEATDFTPLREAVDLLSNTYELEVFLEPGDGIVNSAGSLVASVIDLVDSDGKTIAILDTTVNHVPEVFEYSYKPEVVGDVDTAAHEYILAGCSCLAGDTFGEYSFVRPLEIGSRVVFENVGAYSLVKASMFNGINLPAICIRREDGNVEVVHEFTYDEFLARCGGQLHAPIRTSV